MGQHLFPFQDLVAFTDSQRSIIRSRDSPSHCTRIVSLHLLRVSLQEFAHSLFCCCQEACACHNSDLSIEKAWRLPECYTLFVVSMVFSAPSHALYPQQSRFCYIEVLYVGAFMKPPFKSVPSLVIKPNLLLA